MNARSVPQFVKVALLFALYFGTARLGLWMDAVSGVATAVWPPTGLSLVALSLFGYRLWPGIALGAFLVNASDGVPLPVAGGMAVGNTLEALLGTYLLGRMVGFSNSLDRLRDAIGLVLLAAGLSTLVSATIGVTSGWLGGVIPPAACGRAWWTWWLGDMNGDLVLAPLLFTWVGRPRIPMSPRRVAEAAALLACVVAVGLIAFGGLLAPRITSFHYLLFPVLIWAALRFGPHGATMATFLASVLAIWGTAHGFGPFARATLHEGLLLLQTFMSVVAVTILVLAADVAERRQAQAALQASEYRARAQLAELDQLYNTSPIGLGCVDTRLRYVRVNERLAAINGRPSAEHLGRTLQEVIPQIAPLLEPIYRRVIETGEPVLNLEIHGTTPAGPDLARDFLASYHPMRSLDGVIQGVSLVVQEITERKRGETALRFLAEASAVLASSLDYETTLRQACRLAVGRFAEYCVLEVIEGESDTPRVEVAHADPEKEDLLRERRRCSPPGSDRETPVSTALRTGQPVLVPETTGHSLLVVPLIARGRTLGALSFAAAEVGRRYGSADQALAEALAHRVAIALDNARLHRQIQEADRRKSEFLAMLGHELRNPLGCIANAVQLLQLRGDGDPALRWPREILERQVRQMTRLMDDLLDISRITRGQIELRKETIDLATVVAHAVQSTRPLVEACGHDLSVSLPPAPLWLDADPLRLEQVLVNLLNNAAKYTEPGGRIGLSAEREGADVVLRVRDTGVGIAAEFLPHVFDLFRQADRSLDRAQGGLGIGLTLVRDLVAMHGGRVDAASAGPGQGSEFVVRLPALPAGPPGEPGDGAAAASQPARRLRVLVVEDNLEAAETLAEILQQWGHTVRLAHDGPAAIAVAAGYHPQVVLLDIGLPGMDGYEVARALREQGGLQGALLVALTGYGQEEDRRRSHQAGFDRHLVKPVAFDALRGMLAGGPHGV